MRRREVIALLTGSIALPLPTRGQPSPRPWRIGLLETTDAGANRANLDALRDGLRNLGYVEGRNLAIEYRSAGGEAGRFADMAAELVRLGVDVIVTRGTPAALAARAASSVVPIVMAASGEPSETGVIASLAHPGGNVTGLSSFNTQLELKRLELLLEIIPDARRLGGLYNLGNPVSPPRWEAARQSGLTRGLDAQLFDVRRPADIEPAFQAAAQARVDALTVGMDALTQAERRPIAELAARHRLPAIYPAREFVDDGGLIAYSVSYHDLYLRAATFIDKILKGAKLSELPVEQPTKFELVVNIKAAKALGIEMPESILLRADEVIE
jgi:putative ABC transport system substrate-binding protein